MDTMQIPGFGIVIVKDGKCVYKKGFGTTEVGKSDAVLETTIFPLASGTKNFTATLIARLVEKGLLSWDDKVQKYLPDFELEDAQVSKEFTIRDLLSHRSGLEGFSGDSLWHNLLPAKELLEKLKYIPMKGKFRQDYGYQNIMVGIAGLIIEKVTNKSYAQVLKEELLDPLGLTGTSVGYQGLINNHGLIDKVLGLMGMSHSFPSTKQHAWKNNQVVKIEISDEFYLFPASSGVNTNLNDLEKWLLFHLSNYQVKGQSLISEKIFKEMRTQFVDGTSDLIGTQFPKERIQQIGCGMGWFIYSYGEGKKRIQILEQMGGLTGARSFIAIMPEENMGIAIVANLGGMRSSLMPEALRCKFFDLYLDLDSIDWVQRTNEKFKKNNEKFNQGLNNLRQKNPKPSLDLKNYEGEFENLIYGDCKVTMEGKKLVLNYRGQNIPLQHWNGNYFLMNGRDLSTGYSDTDQSIVEFAFDGKNINGFYISLFFEGQNPMFVRKEVKKN
jgi:CubicO group peptidase (beta-lactamase class C family)